MAPTAWWCWQRSQRATQRTQKVQFDCSTQSRDTPRRSPGQDSDRTSPLGKRKAWRGPSEAKKHMMHCIDTYKKKEKYLIGKGAIQIDNRRRQLHCRTIRARGANGLQRKSRRVAKVADRTIRGHAESRGRAVTANRARRLGGQRAAVTKVALFTQSRRHHVGYRTIIARQADIWCSEERCVAKIAKRTIKSCGQTSGVAKIAASTRNLTEQAIRGIASRTIKSRITHKRCR